MRVVSKSNTMVLPPVREIIHSLELVYYLLIQADKPWYMYNYYISDSDLPKKNSVKSLSLYTAKAVRTNSQFDGNF